VRLLDDDDLRRAGWPLSPWFKAYCERSDWTGTLDGWGAPIPLVTGETIRTALLEFNPSADDIETHAARIYGASRQGRHDEGAHNRPASAAVSNRQIDRLHALCGQLADHIESMNRPALDALRQEGFDGLALVPVVRQARESARHAFGDYPDAHGRGRPPEVEAAEVTNAVAAAFQRITGRRPTFTADPITTKVSGVWPDTLRAVFKVLFIPASVESQVRAHAERERRLRGDNGENPLPD
jgi:hypothetical protein